MAQGVDMDLITLNSRIAELLADGETFEGSEADELIATLPINSKRRNWSLRAAGRFGAPSGGRGLAAAGGIGNASSNGGAHQWHKIDTSGEWMHIGMYRVQHEPGLIHFAPAMPSDAIDGQGEALLHYDRHGRATRMEGSHQRYVQFFRVRLAVVTYRLWKRRA